MNMNHGMLMTGAALLLGVQALYAAQICTSSITATAPDSRYTDNNNGTVTDNKTGLMWKQCSEGLSSTSTPCDTGSAATYTWQGALTQAQTVNGASFAGHSDWRLPNRNELASLLERQCYSPLINLNQFPATPVSNYWSSSPKAPSSAYSTSDAYAWLVSFSSGLDLTSSKNGGCYVRLVRGGQ